MLNWKIIKFGNYLFVYLTGESAYVNLLKLLIPGMLTEQYKLSLQCNTKFCKMPAIKMAYLLSAIEILEFQMNVNL